MTPAAGKVLNAFDALSPAEQHGVAVEILRRSLANDDLPEAALVELADEMFRICDTEDAASGAAGVCQAIARGPRLVYH